jgi:hypothetical protein
VRSSRLTDVTPLSPRRCRRRVDSRPCRCRAAVSVEAPAAHLTARDDGARGPAHRDRRRPDTLDEVGGRMTSWSVPAQQRTSPATIAQPARRRARRRRGLRCLQRYDGGRRPGAGRRWLRRSQQTSAPSDRSAHGTERVLAPVTLAGGGIAGRRPRSRSSPIEAALNRPRRSGRACRLPSTQLTPRHAALSHTTTSRSRFSSNSVCAAACTTSSPRRRADTSKSTGRSRRRDHAERTAADARRAHRHSKRCS